MGYSSATLSRPTFEEAPAEFGNWLRQRSRWIKGWIQTILVHNRNPLRTLGELGFTGSVCFHLMLTAIVVAVLVHPFFLFQTAWQLGTLLDPEPLSGADLMLVGLSFFNLSGGYAAYILLAKGVIERNGGTANHGLLASMPLYWLAISLAGWRGLLQLITRPFYWEKTEHGGGILSPQCAYQKGRVNGAAQNKQEKKARHHADNLPVLAQPRDHDGRAGDRHGDGNGVISGISTGSKL